MCTTCNVFVEIFAKYIHRPINQNNIKKALYGVLAPN
jgi:hypothetical protein